MTREEYERLLKSDYWKGYSYSLIKERNFTCEDCGRCFPNERNKLQVHHLVYRNINPWSYRPDEVLVLCEECHKKRHGIYDKPKQSYRDTTSFSNDDSNDRTHTTYNSNYSNESRNSRRRGCRFRFKFRYVLYLILFGLIVLLWDDILQERANSDKDAPRKEEVKQTPSVSKKKSRENTNQQSADEHLSQQSNELISTDTELAAPNSEQPLEQNETSSEDGVAIDKETASKHNHDNIVSPDENAGVSTEGSTSEIQERIHHANVVERAKRAGVSTEGSTSEIQERIHHANVVERAKRAGIK